MTDLTILISHLESQIRIQEIIQQGHMRMRKDGAENEYIKGILVGLHGALIAARALNSSNESVITKEKED